MTAGTIMESTAPQKVEGVALTVHPDWWWPGWPALGMPGSGWWLVPGVGPAGVPVPRIESLDDGISFTGHTGDTLSMPLQGEGHHRLLITVRVKSGAAKIYTRLDGDAVPLLSLQSATISNGDERWQTFDLSVPTSMTCVAVKLTAPATALEIQSISVPSIAAQATGTREGPGLRSQLLSLAGQQLRPQVDMAGLETVPPPMALIADHLEAVGDHDTAASVRFTAAAASLTDSDVRAVGELLNRWRKGALASIDGVIRYSINDWAALLQSAGHDGTPEELNLRAAGIMTAVEDTYPSATLTARIIDDPESALRPADLTAFLAARPNLDLLNDDLGTIVEPHTDLGAGLQTLQRLARVSHRYDHVNALAATGYRSASAIARTGRSAFIAQQSNTMGTAAAPVFDRASLIATRAFSLYAAHSPTFNTVTPRVMTPSADPAATIPGWRALFADRIDLLTDDPARSVLSPAAYLADILHFLDSIQLDTSTVLQLLLDRRPDLNRLQLATENTEINVPAIDIVNELLECAALAGGVARQPGWCGSTPPLGATATGDHWTTGKDASAAPWRGADTEYHTTAPAAGYHRHGFQVAAASALQLQPGDRLSVWVRPHPDQPPTRLVVRWTSADGDHITTWGADPTTSDPVDHGTVRDRLGARPNLGRWTLLSVPAADIGLETAAVTGIDFGCVDGGCDWGPSGHIAAAPPELTTGSDNERTSQPQQVLWAAYQPLATTVFPWRTQPFDAGYRTATEVCSTLGVPLPTLIASFAAVPNDTETLLPVALARLDISPSEHQILTAADSTPEAEHWGLTDDAGGVWFTRLMKAEEFLPRAELSASDMLTPPGSACCPQLGLSPSADDPGSYVIVGLDTSNVGRLRRYLRLWRKIGGDTAELERFWAAFATDNGAGPDISDDLLIRLSIALTIAQRLGVSLTTVTSWWLPVIDYRQLADPATYPDSGPLSSANSPWAKNFQRPELGVFAEHLAIGADGQLITNLSIDVGKPALCASLNIADDDLTTLLADPLSGAVPAGTDTATAPLTSRIISTLHRVVTFCRATNLSSNDYLSLRALTTIDPFDSAHPANLIRFMEVAAAVATQTISTADLDYLLRHMQRPGSAQTIESTAPTLTAIASAHSEISANHQVQPDPTGDVLRREIGSTPGQSADVVMAALDAAGTYVVGLAGDPDLPTDAPSGLQWQASTAELTSGVLTTAQRDHLLTELSSGAAKTAINELYQQPRNILISLPGVNEALIGQLLDGGEGIEQRHADLLAALVPALVNAATVEAVLDIVTARLAQDRAATTAMLNAAVTADGRTALTVLASLTPDSTAAEQATANDMLTRLDKIGRLVGELKLTPGVTSYWLQFGTQTDWVAANSLPYDTTGQADLSGWLHLCRFWQLRARLGDSSDVLLDIFRRAQMSSAATHDADLQQTLADLSVLAGWNPANVQQLCTTIPLNYPADFCNEQAILQLEQALRVCRQLGAEPTRVAGWATGTLTSDAGADLLAHAHAHTSSAPGLLQPVEDLLRLKRRDALRDHLVMANATTGDASSLSTSADNMLGQLLTDTEVSTGTTTTRVAAATHAVQLLVQRALLDLEPTIVLSEDLRQEWSWKSSYSSWAADRENFIHPENFLVPDQRGDATSNFAALKTELTHGELNADDAATAFTHYLQGVDEVAQLEPAALYQQTDDGNVTDSTLHVIGRTRATPHIYYYRVRSFVGWTAWQPLGVEIAGDNLSAYVLDGRLHLFWLETLDQGKVPDKPSQNSIVQPDMLRQHRLAWTIQDDSGWSAKKMSNDTIVVPADVAAANVFLDTTWTTDESLLNLPVRVYDTPSPASGQSTYVEHGLFVFDAAAQSAGVATSTAQGVINAPSGDGLTTAVAPAYQGWQVPDGKLSLPSGSGFSDAVFTTIDKPARLLFTTAPEWILNHQRQSVDSHLPFFFDISGLPLFATDEADGTDARTYHFELAYHPYTKALVRQLVRGGVSALLARSAQIEPSGLASDRAALNFPVLGPTASVDTAAGSIPTETLDFTSSGPYATYNWELFFHGPSMIAQRLSRMQRYEEARDWFGYIFDPTDRSNNSSPQKYWQTKPLFEFSGDVGIEQLIADLKGDANSDAEKQVAAWLAEPFDPDVIARMRLSAYQKAIVMAYLDNLIAWADSLLGDPTAESVQAATQLYLFASDILGPAPLAGPKPSALTGDSDSVCFQDLRLQLDSFSDAVVQLENRVAVSTAPVTGPPSYHPSPAAVLLPSLYFHVPANQKLLNYWDVINQRLSDIRAGLGLQGQPLELAPYPSVALSGRPSSALAGGTGSAAARPIYRFSTLFAKAMELTNEVRALGSALLTALEKQDAEALSIMRANQELAVLASARQIRETQLTESAQQIAQLRASRLVTAAKASYYATRERYSEQELLQVGHLKTSAILQATSQKLDALGTVVGMIPEFNLGASGFSASPVVTAAIGGRELATVAAVASRIVSMNAGSESHLANMASISAGWQRRWEEWQFQASQANLEINQMDVQIAAALTRQQQAQQELDQQDLQIRNSTEVNRYLQTKFTTAALYDWMAGQLITLYGQAYRLAVQTAQRAERCFQFELADSSTFVTNIYWDSLHKGLGAADLLSADLRRMENAYFERNVRTFEITKNVSLALCAPDQLVKLRATGECYLDLPEAIFDLDYPGHYLRRLRRVAISVPCVTGPYTGVNCTLSLLSDHTRVQPSLQSGKYVRQGLTDTRFLDRYGISASIVTSGGLNQNGTFEATNKDDRYEQFEGAGAVSRWHIELLADTNGFPVDTLTDIVLHLQYSARDGGQSLKNACRNEVVTPTRRNGMVLISARTDFSEAWQQYQSGPDDGTPRILTLPIDIRNLPVTAGADSHIVDAQVLAIPTTATADATVNIKPPGSPAADVALTADGALNGILDGTAVLPAAQPMGDWTVTVAHPDQLPLADFLLLLTYAP